MDKKKLILAIVVLSVIGIVLTTSLVGAKYLNKMTELCGFGPQFGEHESCIVVQSSPYSYIINGEYFGVWITIPLSLAGLLYYILILGLSLDMLSAYKRDKKVSVLRTRIYLGFAVLGALFSIAFLYIQGFLIGAFCKYCVLSAILTFLILALAIMFSR